ncbi:FUSC family protein [Gordonia sp. DT30]|uniref:FUSC family protein n=1 Tax=unclassified Gordonia (in: high G+C Gram-positive bacteria) TaxID=2657482 RepID=UPI003CF2F9C1
MENDDRLPRPPARPSIRRALLAVPDIRGRWEPAIRAGLSFALPATALCVAGLERDALLAALGAFAALYGEKRPYRVRWRAVTTAALVLVAAVAGYGALGAWAGPDATIARNMVVVAALVAGAAVASFTATAIRLGPPGPYFFVLTAAVASVVTRHGVDLGPVVIATAAGGLGSLIVSMAPALWRPHAPETAATLAAMTAIEGYLEDNSGADRARRHGVAFSTLNAWSVLHDAAATNGALARQLWESMHRLHGVRKTDALVAPLGRPTILHRLRGAAEPYSHAQVTAVRVTAAALCAGVISVLVHLSRPDWAILGAVLVLQLGPDRIRGVIRGSHRLLGTIVGLGLFVVFHLLDLGIPALIVLIAILNVLIELTVVGNYAVAVTFITPLAMLMGTPESNITIPVRDRLLETFLGVGLAIAAMWVVGRHAHRKTARRADAAVLDDVGRTLATITAEPVGTSRSLTIRRDLQWTLLEAEMSATDAAGDEPEWARAHWPHHAAACQVGYDTLSWCWRTDRDRSLDPVIAGLLADRRGIVDRM